MNTDSPNVHLDPATAQAYAGRLVDPIMEFSIEQHLLRCARCRHLIAAAAAQGTLADVSRERLQSVWSAVAAKIDAPTTADPRTNHYLTLLTSRLRRLLPRFDVTPSLTRGRLQVAAAAVVVAVTGLSAVLLRSSGTDEHLAHPQPPAAVVQLPLAPTVSVLSAVEEAPPVGGLSGPTPITVQGDGAHAPTTAAPTRGASTTSTPPARPAPVTFHPNQYIVVLWVAPAADPGSEKRAETKRKQLGTAGVPALTLRTRDFPDLHLVGGNTPAADSFVVYAGPFEILASAAAFCQSQPAIVPMCLPLRLSPNG
jgi:hypothetical protein